MAGEDGTVTLLGHIEIVSFGTHFVITRPLSVGRDAVPLSPSLAASKVDAWCESPRTLADLLGLYEDLAGEMFRPPTSADINEWIKPRLRRAFQEGELVVLESSLFDRTEKQTEQGVHAKPTKLEPPPLPPAPRRPVSPPKTLHSFAIRFVDELGAAISDIDIAFAHDGTTEDVTTDGSGVARVEDSPARTARTKVADVKALRKALKERWNLPRSDRKWLDETAGVTVVPLKDPLPHFDLAADKLRIVSIQPYVTRVRLLGGFFDSEKCFPLPVVLDGVRSVVSACKKHPAPTLLVVGHTDSAGKADYNDKLSLERAEATKDFLKDNVDGWLKWYDAGVPAGKRWGRVEDSLMILALPDAATRALDQDAIRWFQESRGLTVDGIAGPQTRRALVAEYMKLEGTSLPNGVEVVTHGCGEHFPDVPSPDSSHTPQNRRVECFVFDRGSGVQPPPPGKNSAKGALEYPEWCRRAKETEDHTHDFARIRVQPRLGSAFRYALRVGSLAYEDGRAADGVIDHQVPADAASGTLVIHLPDSQETFEWELQIGTLDAPQDVTGMQQRLVNLGYHSGPVSGSIDEATQGALRLFQEDYKLSVTGEYDAPTQNKLRSLHDELAT